MRARYPAGDCGDRRLRAAGRCLEIDQDELAFTGPEEAALAGLLDAPRPIPGLAGWPALVRLALTSRSAATHEFLWEEVVGGLPPTRLRGLLGLGLVGWADAASLSAICAEPVDVAELAAAVPLISQTPDGVARAHDLWGEALERLDMTGEIGELLPRAAAVLEARQDVVRLAEIARRFGGPALIRVAARELVRHTLSSVPLGPAEALVAAAAPDLDSPELLLLQAALAHARVVGDPRIDPMVAEATAAFAASGDQPGEIAALVLAGQVAHSRGAYLDFLRIATRMAEIPDARRNITLHVVSQLVAATLADLKGDLSGALDCFAALPPPETRYPMREVVCRLHPPGRDGAGRRPVGRAGPPPDGGGPDPDGRPPVGSSSTPGS